MLGPRRAQPWGDSRNEPILVDFQATILEGWAEFLVEFHGVSGFGLNWMWSLVSDSSI